ncbi:MAG: hypothetical protein ACHQNT_04725 [Bacteroidia bacterium]
MENEKQFSESESIHVIQRMITTAKNELVDDSFQFRLWGWLVFAASMGHYILWQIDFGKPHLVWLLMPLGGIVSYIYGKRQNEKQRVKTYVDDVMKYVLLAFLFSLLIVLFFMSKLGLNCYPMVMVIYAIWLFASGGALQFRPLIVGGVANWLLGITAFFVTFDIQLLLLAAAVLIGFIIPGHLLKAKYEKSKTAVAA